MSALEYLQGRLYKINENNSRTIWNLDDRAMVSNICIAFQGQTAELATKDARIIKLEELLYEAAGFVNGKSKYLYDRIDETLKEQP